MNGKIVGLSLAPLTLTVEVAEPNADELASMLVMGSRVIVSPAALSPSSSAPADEYRRGVEDAAQIVEGYMGRSPSRVLATLRVAHDRIRALAPSPSSAAPKEEA